MSDRSIKEAINKLTGLHKVDQVSYVNAVVDNVDISKRTCDCTAIDGHTEYELPGVRLMAVVDDGILFEPVIGSTVKVIFSQNIEPFVCQYSEVENITLHANTKIQFNDGTFGGLVQINPLIEKINNLENDLNNLKSLFASWSIIPSDGGAALKTITTKWSTEQIKNTVLVDLENTKISHGQ